MSTIAITFDTLDFARKLRNAGINEKHAEAITDAVRDSHINTNNATKDDIAKLDVKIAETKAELVKWIVSVALLQTSIITALLLKLIPS